MKINIIAMGQKLEPWVQQGFFEYQKRFTANLQVNLIELPIIKRTKATDINRILTQEGEIMLQAIHKNDLVIALEVTGTKFSSPQLALQLEKFYTQGQNISILIGGPEGLAPSCQQRANHSWSLSDLTLPHPLARLILIEALYRAWTILKHHPYHKD